MKKLFAVLPVAALALAAACSDNAIGPDDAAFAKTSPTTVPTSNGPVFVNGTTFTITYVTAGGSLGAGENGHPQRKGTCALNGGPRSSAVVSGNQEDNVQWYNEAGNWTNAPFCRLTSNEPQTKVVTCTLSPLQATYAFGGTGQPVGFQTASNELLNALTDATDLQPINRVHYNGRKIETNGLGTVNVGFSCVDGAGNADAAGTADINLTFTRTGNAFEPFSAVVDGISQAGRQIRNVPFTLDIKGASDAFITGNVDLQWTFRSRNGIPLTTQL